LEKQTTESLECYKQSLVADSIMLRKFQMKIRTLVEVELKNTIFR
jgi:hypothetical protein